MNLFHEHKQESDVILTQDNYAAWIQTIQIKLSDGKPRVGSGKRLGISTSFKNPRCSGDTFWYRY